jgi:6-phosphofructokinase 1
MAGSTGMIVGYWNNQFTHVPIALSVSKRKKIDPEGWVWNSVIASTGQPVSLV